MLSVQPLKVATWQNRLNRVRRPGINRYGAVRNRAHKLASVSIPATVANCRIQYCASCLAEDRAPHFRWSWRLASRISCLRHGCGLRDRCPACRGGVAPFAQTELVAQHVCVPCGFDLRRAARASVTVAARRLERAIDYLCSAGPADGSSRIEALVASLLRVPGVAGGSSLLLSPTCRRRRASVASSNWRKELVMVRSRSSWTSAARGADRRRSRRSIRVVPTSRIWWRPMCASQPAGRVRR